MAGERTKPSLPVRTDDPALARSSLEAASSLDLSDDDLAGLSDEFAHLTELVGTA
jgi:hypothetical protein